MYFCKSCDANCTSCSACSSAAAVSNLRSCRSLRALPRSRSASITAFSCPWIFSFKTPSSNFTSRSPGIVSETPEPSVAQSTSGLACRREPVNSCAVCGTAPASVASRENRLANSFSVSPVAVTYSRGPRTVLPSATRSTITPPPSSSHSSFFLLVESSVPPSSTVILKSPRSTCTNCSPSPSFLPGSSHEAPINTPPSTSTIIVTQAGCRLINAFAFAIR